MSFKNFMENEQTFDYSWLAKPMWQEKVQEAKKLFNIYFDTENDEPKESKEIKTSDDKFKCELRMAGGDWEQPLVYFRCQSFNDKLNTFCFIPNTSEGNDNLVKRKNKWFPADGNDLSVPSPNQSKCWKALKEYLKNRTNTA